MINFAKRVVSDNTNASGELYKAIVCALMCDIQSDEIKTTNLTLEVRRIRNCMMHKVTGTPLDYAELYQGNSVLFLRIYQDHFGPIE